MIEDSTWLKLHRKMVDWEWYTDQNCFRVFVHLLLTVNYKTSRFRGLEVPAGSRVIGRHALALECGLSEQQVRTALDKLKSTNTLTSKSTSKFSIISICNWGKYQSGNQQVTSKITNNQPASNQQNNQQVTTSKERKKERKKEGKNIVAIRELGEFEFHPLDGHYQKWFEDKCPSIDRFEKRDAIVRWCRAKGKSYKDYWSALQDWALRDQNQKKTKSKSNDKGGVHPNEKYL